MKTTLSFLLLAASTLCLQAQLIQLSGKAIQDGNDLRVQMHSCGDIGWDLTGEPGFEAPVGSGKHPIFASTPWMGALDASGSLRMAAQTYRQTGLDYYPGPGATFYDSAYLARYDRVFEVTRAETDAHQRRWNQTGYTTPDGIRDWPAHGDTTNGEPWLLAPFVDVDGDQVYRPGNGDYPWFQGDKVLYTIYNDQSQPHTETGGLPLYVDIHTSTYVFDRPAGDPLDQTLFVKHRIINRGSQTLYNLIIGQWTDIDLGFFRDDFIGCDTIRNAYFGYNGDPFDEGTNGYGNRPPAVAVKFLNQRLGSFVNYRNDFSGQGNPRQASDYYNYLSGKWADGSDITVGGDGTGGTRATRYAFSGNPLDTSQWSMQAEPSIFPADMRGLGATPSLGLSPGKEICLEMAFIFAQTDTGDNLHSLRLLQQRMDQVQAHYDSLNATCGQNILSQPLSAGPAIAEPDFGLAPNPAHDRVTVSLPEAGEYVVQIHDLLGRSVLVQEVRGSREAVIETQHMKPGTYIVSTQWKGQSLAKKLIKY